MKAGFNFNQLTILFSIFISLNIFDLQKCRAVPIVGGRIVPSEGSGKPKYPFMVSLQDVSKSVRSFRNFNQTRANYHFCGGSLIGDRWILTAAHCIWRKNIKQIVAFIGYESIENVHYLEPYSVDRAEYIYFQPLNYRNDIALLHLSRSYKSQLSGDLLYAQLPTQPVTQKSNETCRIIGYGATRHAGPSQTQLFEADVRVIDNEHCRNIIGHIWAPKNGGNTVCALGNNQDSCQGDSGGPLICPYGNGGGDYVYGLVSHGLTCGIKGMPSIYTVARPYNDWIQLIMQKS